jgi:hypothetical protein
MEDGVSPTTADSPWSDRRFVVEGLEAASCGAHAKALAIEGIALAEAGGTAEEWRLAVAARHHDHPGWREHLAEAERCMRASGIWPWEASARPSW